MAVNLTPISELLQGIVGFVPDLIAFVVGLVPLTVTMMLVGFIGAVFAKIITHL